MIKLTEPINKQKPSHYIINSSKGALNHSYSCKDDYDEAIIMDSIIYGKENIKGGEIEDLTCYLLFDESETQGGKSKADNKGKIL